MSKKEKLLNRLLTGNSDSNFDIDDLVTILNRLGFNERNTGGIHRIFTIDGIEGIIICKTQKMARQTPTR